MFRRTRPAWPATALAFTLGVALAGCSSNTVVDLTDTGPILVHRDTGTGPAVDTGNGTDAVTHADGDTPTDTLDTADSGTVCGLCASPDQVCCPTLRVCFVPGLQDCPVADGGPTDVPLPTDVPVDLDAPLDDVPGDGADGADGGTDAEMDGGMDGGMDAGADAHMDARTDAHTDAPRDGLVDVPDPCMNRCNPFTLQVCCPTTGVCFIPGHATCRSYDAGVLCTGVTCSPFAVCCPSNGRCVPRGCATCCPP